MEFVEYTHVETEGPFASNGMEATDRHEVLGGQSFGTVLIIA
jgi:hypothetical protein